MTNQQQPDSVHPDPGVNPESADRTIAWDPAAQAPAEQARAGANQTPQPWQGQTPPQGEAQQWAASQQQWTGQDQPPADPYGQPVQDPYAQQQYAPTQWTQDSWHQQGDQQWQDPAAPQWQDPQHQWAGQQVAEQQWDGTPVQPASSTANKVGLGALILASAALVFSVILSVVGGASAGSTNRGNVDNDAAAMAWLATGMGQIVPTIMGVAALGMGIYAWTRKNRLGIFAVIVAIVAPLLSMVVHFIVLAASA